MICPGMIVNRLPGNIEDESPLLPAKNGRFRRYRIALVILLPFFTSGIWTSCSGDPNGGANQPSDPAAYMPNREFEEKLGGYVRSSSGSAKMKSPKIGENFSPENGAVKITFLGTMPAASDIGPQPLTLKIYSNQPVPGQPLFSASPEIANRTPAEWTFSVEQQLPLAPGLYYFKIERTVNEDPVFVGKFIVGKNPLPKR